MEKKSILNWLTQLHEDGNELSIGWEGGGDSGWCYFKIDASTVENEYTTALVDYMYDELNYGSWAGEFSANGEAIYDHESKSFEGTDYYSEDGHSVINSNIIIRVPKKLWFETLSIEVECYYDDGINTDASFVIKNGFLTDEHSTFCSNLEEVLKDDFDALFTNYKPKGDYEFRGCNDNWLLERSEGVEDEDDLVFTIKKVEIQTIETEDKNIVFELTEDIINNIDHRINTHEDEN